MPKEATLNLTNKIPQQPRFLLIGSAYCFLISVSNNISNVFLFVSGIETSRKSDQTSLVVPVLFPIHNSV